ncbi:hypothetical protein FHX44_116535 [Pseudonocardia hierapolitana]|uniref:Uncharacterized protein n=1 Tax=Pseudonocardia hierapolitana TaxID=1128676 RepID=A0A561T0F2_9PSEU|nr:hypothetical protein [Pseudonocardia hierapolitana]TWF80592.1 hypothetical protein FHX44_116535 [Pseudonocardia hierapolitana]
MEPPTVAPNEIDLTARTRSTQVARAIVHALTLLIAAGCLASFVAGPEEPAVRLIAGAAGLLIVLLYAWVIHTRRRLPARLVIDHEGIRVLDGRGRKLVRLAWTELSGVGVMTNEVSRRRQLRRTRDDLVPWVSRRIVLVPIWLELYPADAQAVARHTELEWAWALGGVRAPGEEHRWLVSLGDGQGQRVPIGEAVQRWRPQLWRGHRSGSFLLGGEGAWNKAFLEAFAQRPVAGRTEPISRPDDRTRR